MAVIETQTPNDGRDLQVHRLPQSKYVDGVRWLPPLSAFDKFVVLSLFDSDSSSSTIEVCSPSAASTSTTLSPVSSLSVSSRTSCLRALRSHQKPLVAFSTFSGSFHLFSPHCTGDLGSGHGTHLSLSDESFHTGPISCIDGLDDGEFVSVGEDGRINLTSFAGGGPGLRFRRVFDSSGLVSYSSVKWASPTEFATGGVGFNLHWWDLRKPGGPASQFKCNWPQKTSGGIVHSIDIHPSRKHTCMAGGSSGTVFGWDLRSPQQSIVLCGAGTAERGYQLASESEVWEVQCDSHMQSSHISSLSSSKTLPVMMCSEDGILASIEQGIEPVELLAEPCAINSFDIDKQSPSNIICALEWESVAILTRA